jgi:hypothetical protein
MLEIIDLIHSGILNDPGPISIRLENPKVPKWDDATSIRRDADDSCQSNHWKIKRQKTPLRMSEFEELLRIIPTFPNDYFHLAMLFPVEVKSLGSLTTLQDLCDRLSQMGAEFDYTFLSLTISERQWIDFAAKAFGLHCDDNKALIHLSRLNIRVVPTERDLEKLITYYLGTIFRKPNTAFSQIVKHLSSNPDAIININYDLMMGTVMKDIELLPYISDIQEIGSDSVNVRRAVAICEISRDTLIRKLHKKMRESLLWLNRLTNPVGPVSPNNSVLEGFDRAFGGFQDVRLTHLLDLPAPVINKLEEMAITMSSAKVRRCNGGLDGWIQADERFDLFHALLKEVEIDFRRLLGVE